MIYLELLIGFLKVGLFSFGGAYGAIPLIRDVVLSYGWISDETLTYMIAVSESTPGPIMVNLATYIGYHQGGVLGSAVATFAVILPAYLVILLVLGILKNTIKNPYVQAVLRGLKPCVTGIVLATGIYMVLQNCLLPHFDLRGMIVTGILGAILIAYRLIFKKKLSPLVLIGISACLGIIVFSI